MCGITGFWQFNDFSADRARAVATTMAERIAYRGPDDYGVWLDEPVGLALAHRRLSIVDLSPAGHQPMLSGGGRYVMAFNGEIYNHQKLRQELEAVAACNWRGHSDTETLLAGFETWGIEATLKKAVGMFAIALWDRNEKVLTLARDRIGEKPLYYGFQKDTFVFGSELKAFKAHPDFVGEIDRDVICLYLRHCYIPAPYSIYKGIRKLLPGTFLQLPLGGGGIDALRTLLPRSYWDLQQITEDGMANPFAGSEEEAVSALEAQLKTSIGLQMMADVPLGAFLSGGIDSSAVVALMQAQSDRPVKTFTIGFDEQGFNEAEYAKAVAQHLGTEHTELYVPSSQARDVIPHLGQIYDEPFADSSQIPTFLVAQMAKSEVTVSLSGDAGDELFCGYNRYLLADKWEKLAGVPFPVRKMTGKAVNLVPATAWNSIFSQAGKLRSLPMNMGDKLSKFASRLENVDAVDDLYYSLVSETDQPEQIVLGAHESACWLTDVGLRLGYADHKSHMMLMDAMTYLPDDILVKVDRAAMANSLETRVPFLDHRVIELASTIPMSMKCKDGKTKWILREVLYRYVPRELIERPKAGFGIPLGVWLRGPLREWAETLLDEQRLQREGYFDVKFVRELWQAHVKGRNNQTLLWNILMFQAWLEGD
ncbi:MAG: asparagine synthase (glutamine-hydrolyzing) [Gallionella sp.]|nr:asparagine synthase (glutamine-hydrolyzing) [Gallionella sp.]